MDEPPVTISHPSYVVAYALVDSTVIFIDRKTLNVGGEWLGEVPKLAICKNIETAEFHLSHCSNEWDDLCAVQTSKTIEGIKSIAEKHYRGIDNKWIATNYNEIDAIEIFEEEKEKFRCSFCGKSHYDEDITSIATSETANICNICIKSYYEAITNENS